MLGLALASGGKALESGGPLETSRELLLHEAETGRVLWTQSLSVASGGQGEASGGLVEASAWSNRKFFR